MYNNMTFQQVQGKVNKTADTLSRLLYNTDMKTKQTYSHSALEKEDKLNVKSKMQVAQQSSEI